MKVTRIVWRSNGGECGQTHVGMVLWQETAGMNIYREPMANFQEEYHPKSDTLFAARRRSVHVVSNWKWWSDTTRINCLNWIFPGRFIYYAGSVSLFDGRHAVVGLWAGERGVRSTSSERKYPGPHAVCSQRRPHWNSNPGQSLWLRALVAKWYCSILFGRTWHRFEVSLHLVIHFSFLYYSAIEHRKASVVTVEFDSCCEAWRPGFYMRTFHGRPECYTWIVHGVTGYWGWLATNSLDRNHHCMSHENSFLRTVM